MCMLAACNSELRGALPLLYSFFKGTTVPVTLETRRGGDALWKAAEERGSDRPARVSHAQKLSLPLSHFR